MFGGAAESLEVFNEAMWQRVCAEPPKALYRSVRAQCFGVRDRVRNENLVCRTWGLGYMWQRVWAAESPKALYRSVLRC